jgi:K+-transporting ATPase KdpF subunit
MSIMIMVSAVVTVALLLYLAVVIAKPEWFQ